MAIIGADGNHNSPKSQPFLPQDCHLPPAGRALWVSATLPCYHPHFGWFVHIIGLPPNFHMIKACCYIFLSLSLTSLLRFHGALFLRFQNAVCKWNYSYVMSQIVIEKMSLFIKTVWHWDQRHNNDLQRMKDSSVMYKSVTQTEPRQRSSLGWATQQTIETLSFARKECCGFSFN